MSLKMQTPKEFLDSLPADRKQIMSKLRSGFRKHLPKGYKEVMGTNMLSYVVPKSLFPDGYHVNPNEPLPFISLASQKNFIAVYHMGIYADKKLHKWFVGEYPKHCAHKLDMGKSCIRLKKMDDIPFELIADLATKMSVDDWVILYQKAISSRK